MVITASTVMGGIDVYVNAHTKVIVDGVGIMGAFDQGRDKVEPALDALAGGPGQGLALMGAVTVTRKPMPGEPKGLRRRWGH